MYMYHCTPTIFFVFQLMHLAGGLAVYLHADFVKTMIPKMVTTYKAFADGG